jgi:hypothetical protein
MVVHILQSLSQNFNPNELGSRSGGGKTNTGKNACATWGPYATMGFAFHGQPIANDRPEV